MSGLKRKTAKEGTCRTQERKEHSQLQADREQSAFSQRDSRIKISRTQCTQEDRGDEVRWNFKFPLFRAPHRRRQSRQRFKLGRSAVAVHRRGHRVPCVDAEAARIQKIVV